MNRQTLYDCTSCILREFSVSAGCESSLLSLQNTVSSIRLYEKDTIIFSKGDEANGIYCIHDGSLALAKTTKEEKDGIVIRTIGSGAIFGVEETVNNLLRQSSAYTLTRARLCFIPKVSFLDMLCQNPQLADRIIQELCHTILTVEHSVAISTHFSA